MGLPSNHDQMAYRRPSWRVFIIVLAICGLSVSLATRTFHVKIHQGTTVTAYSAEPMRQHLNRDAMRWVAPNPVFIVFESPALYLPVAPAAPQLPGVLFDESLSNRPPPSC
jgi:hypothetical protein